MTAPISLSVINLERAVVITLIFSMEIHFSSSLNVGAVSLASWSVQGPTVTGSKLASYLYHISFSVPELEAHRHCKFPTKRCRFIVPIAILSLRTKVATK